jgi:rhodanese-related sulfurtransferase
MSKLKPTIITIILFASFNGLFAQPDEITYLDPDNFQIQYQSEVYALLLDVSLKREYNRSRIKGAIGIHRMKKLEIFADTLDREIPIYIYCDGESRALTVAEYLQYRGFRKVIILRGGIRYWKAAGLPLEKGRKAYGKRHKED